MDIGYGIEGYRDGRKEMLWGNRKTEVQLTRVGRKRKG